MTAQLLIPELLGDGPEVDPIHATFVGGAKDPFCRWYPYLEGYSPEFVRAILASYSPSARVVLDPFGGTATTAFASAAAGADALICEVNPVLQFIFDAKTNVRMLSGPARAKLAETMQDVARRTQADVRRCARDADLERAYSA